MRMRRPRAALRTSHGTSDAEHFMTRAGPSICFLPAFPTEEEFLFPPLTYLEPIGEPQDDAHYTMLHYYY